MGASWGFSSVKKTVKDLAVATSAKDSGISQCLSSQMAHSSGATQEHFYQFGSILHHNEQQLLP
jgi:hypothetical protein